MGLDEAMQIILRESGSHFDPRIATAFMDIAPALYVTITQAEPNELQQRLHEALSRYFKLGSCRRLCSSRQAQDVFGGCESRRAFGW
jgi:hypothetical protein